MTPDDDTQDLIIHARIDNALRMLVGGRRLSRPDATGALLACARNAANPNLEHMIEAILVNTGISRADLCDRIQAVIELDEEEARERAFREACTAEEAEA